MDAKQFFELTAQMRDAQKGYFKTPASQYQKKHDYLILSKKLEAQLDAEIKRVRDIQQQKEIEEYKRKAPTLFGFGE